MYTKLFGSIVHSTIWREDDYVRLVWITMLALSDKKGCVWASVPGLADAARVDLAQCEAALERLSSPDPYSRTQEAEGRRIEAIDGGWWLINHAKFQAIKNIDERREQVRQAVGRHRAKKKVVIKVIPGNQGKSEVIDVSPSDKTRPDKTNSTTTTAAPAAGKKVVASWLQPFGHAWTDRYGGQMVFGQVGKALGPLIKDHGPEEVLRRWRIYLAATEASYANPAKFAATFGTWNNAKREAAGKPTTAEQMEASMRRVFSGPRE